MVPVAVSTAVIVWLPEVFRVTVMERLPRSDGLKAVSAGKTALGSLEVKWTVPLYSQSAPPAAWAVRGNVKGAPATVLIGGARFRLAAVLRWPSCTARRANTGEVGSGAK